MTRLHVLVALVAASLLGLAAYGLSQDRRADRAETALAEARETLARRDAELDAATADVAELRARTEEQNAAVDELAARGERQAARVAAADAEARLLREISRTRVDAVLSAPPPATCDGALALLRGAAPDASRSWEPAR